MILYLASDLIWSTKIRATADALGIPARPVRSLAMLEARLVDTQPAALLVDLDAPEVALALINRLRSPAADERAKGIRIIAWGPHVEKALLQEARDAGADDVLTRGAFDHDLEHILLTLSGRT